MLKQENANFEIIFEDFLNKESMDLFCEDLNTEKIQHEYKKITKSSMTGSCAGTDYQIINQIIISLGSAGVFTALYRIICKYLERNQQKEAIIKIGNNETIHLKGFSAKESELLLQSTLKNSDTNKVTVTTKKIRMKKGRSMSSIPSNKLPRQIGNEPKK